MLVVCEYETNKSHRALVAISEAVFGAHQLMLASMASSKSNNPYHITGSV